jgi:hypothetical protein
VFPGVSQRWEFKNTTKNVLQKVRVEKFYLYKKIDKNPKPNFLAAVVMTDARRLLSFVADGGCYCRCRLDALPLIPNRRCLWVMSAIVADVADVGYYTDRGS